MEKINIVVSCTAGKNLPSSLEYDDYYPVDGEDWWEDAKDVAVKTPALHLYKGPGADKFRTIRTKLAAKYDVTVWILSAGFGLVREDTYLPGYDATFSSMAKENKVKAADYKTWLKSVSIYNLPRNSIIMLPNSYLKPFKALEDLNDHIQLGPFGGEVREHFGWSMIRTQLNACEKIVEHAMENDIPPEQWDTINPLELD